MTLPDRAEQRRRDRRIGARPIIERKSDRERRETQPPRDRPKWNILERQADADKIAELQRKIDELESTNMAREKSLALTQYGDKKDLDMVRDRVALTPYGASLDQKGRSMVAQICYLLDWNPFFDMHAWAQGGKLCMVPDYKKLLSMAKEQQRINHSSRPMSDQERIENGLTDNQIGFVTEIKEIDALLEFARAGIASEYSPVTGYGIWSPGESIPATWTKQMVARKRSLRNALYQLTSYKIVSKRFHDALVQIGAVSVDSSEDGFAVELPELITEGDEDAPHFWDDSTQRQTFWIGAKVLGKNKVEIAAALDLPDGVTKDSATWKPFMSQFPDLENALAYVNVVAENIKQQAEESAAPEVVQADDEPVVFDGMTGEVIEADSATCANCSKPATGKGPYPNLCADHAETVANAHAKKSEG